MSFVSAELSPDVDLASLNEQAITMISMRRSGLIRRTDFMYARVAEPQLASLNVNESIDFFPVALLSTGLKEILLVLRLASTLLIVIAPIS